MLILQRKKGQAIHIGDNIIITVTDVGNDQVKLAIDAPREISIVRNELLEAKKVNEEAANLTPEAIHSLTSFLSSTKDKPSGIDTN